MTEIDLDRTTGLVSLGTHTFKIDRVREEMGSSGYPYWGFTCVCIDQKGSDRGKEGYLMISLSPQARFKLDEFLDAVKAPKSGKANKEQFVGKIFRADVIHEEYEGRTQVRFNKLIAYDGQLGMEMGEESEDQEAEEAEEAAVPDRPKSRDPFS